MPAPRSLKDLQSFLYTAVVPLGVWILVSLFYGKGFLAGSGTFECILFSLIAVAALVCLFESTAVPLLLQKLCLEYPIFSAGAALLVYGGVHLLKTTPVIACAAIGTAAGLLGRSDDGTPGAYVPSAYCGGFVGMTSSLILVSAWWIVLAGLLAGCLYSVSGEAIRGMGGKLGSIAFGSVFLTVLLAKSSMAIGPGPKLIRLDSAAKVAILLASLCAAPISYWLAQQRGLGPVLGSALPSVVVAITLPWLGHWVPFATGPVATAWFGASFVGMTSPQRIAMRNWMLPVMGLLFGILWIGFKPPLVGLGGVLGATATVSVLGVLGGVRLVAGTRQAANPLGQPVVPTCAVEENRCLVAE